MPDIYKDLNYSAEQVDDAIAAIGSHIANNSIHVNQTEKDSWNANVTEVIAARGGESSLSAKIATKQDALTFDNTPTAGSSNPVKSSGIKTAIMTEETARKAECGVIANLGAKNLLEITGTSQTVRDVIITVGADGTVTTSGTASAASNAFIFGTITPKKTGNYIVSTGSAHSASGIYNVQIREGTTTTGTLIDRVYNDPVTISLTQGTTYALRLYFNSDVNVSDTFKMMIQPDEITDTDFVPYAPTNRELYEMILALQSGTRSLQSLSPAGLNEDDLRSEPNEDEQEVR